MEKILKFSGYTLLTNTCLCKKSYSKHKLCEIGLYNLGMYRQVNSYQFSALLSDLVGLYCIFVGTCRHLNLGLFHNQKCSCTISWWDLDLMSDLVIVTFTF